MIKGRKPTFFCSSFCRAVKCLIHRCRFDSTFLLFALFESSHPKKSGFSSTIASSSESGTAYDFTLVAADLRRRFRPLIGLPVAFSALIGFDGPATADIDAEARLVGGVSDLTFMRAVRGRFESLLVPFSCSGLR